MTMDEDRYLEDTAALRNDTATSFLDHLRLAAAPLAVMLATALPAVLLAHLG
jgi:hypothetical protein